MNQNFNDIRPSARDLQRPPTRWALENTRVQKALGITPHQYDAYRVAVGQIESGCNPNMGAGGAGKHYWGPYQFGTAATSETCKFLGENITKQQFKGNQELAERHFDALSYLNHQSLMRHSPRYRAMSPTEKLGVLGYAHNQGAGGAAQWLATGHAGRDGFGTSGKKYFDAILDGLKKVGDFIVGGLKFIWDHTIGALFNSGQKPPEQQPPHLHPQPGLQKPNHGKWQFNMAPEQTYAPFQPPVRPGFTPERGTLPTNGWVNNQPLNGQALGNPVQSNVVMGDSIGVSMKSQYQGVKNVAVGGWSIQRAIKQFERVPQGSVADVYLGSNNGPCTPEQNRQQTLAFLRAADAHGVRINNWILPGEYPGHPKADAQLKVVADVIRQTVQEYNMTHKQDQRITPIETRGKGIELYPRDLHLTTTGNQQLKAQIASQHNAARHATYASAEPRPQPIPLNEWRMKNPEPKKSA